MASVLPGAEFPDETRNGDRKYLTFHVRGHEKCFVLDSSSGSQFAVLDNNTTSRLAVLADLAAVRLEAVVDFAEMAKRRKKRKTNFGIFSVSINLLGPGSLSTEVATRLGTVSGYLQHPKTVAEGIEYQNPQFLRFQDDNSQMQNLVGIVGNLHLARRARVADELDRILESLAEASSDYELPPCDGLMTPLKRYALVSMLPCQIWIY
jgi:hypothetical protein